MEYEVFVPERIAQLRLQKNVSARDMSLSLGQAANYINSIENRKALPSMQSFFYICEYLGVTPQEFFDEGNACPVRLRELLAGMAQDRIILVATHVVSDVESVATKVILLRAGKIVDAAPVPDLIAAHAPGGGLEDVYLNVFGEGDGK